MLSLFVVLREEREPWRRQAACIGHPHSSWWFPVRGPGKPRAGDESPAYPICDACPVRVECRAYADRQGDVEGIWGGVEYRRGVPLTEYYRKPPGD